MYHIATVNAFKNKFGTFTGAILDKSAGTVLRERFPTMDNARNWVKAETWKMFGPVKFASMPRKGEYYANVWQA